MKQLKQRKMLLPILRLIFIIACVYIDNYAAGLSTIATEESQNRELQEFTEGCYFSAEYQGQFVMQVSSNGNGLGPNGRTTQFDEAEPIVQYSTINITYNAIPVWGYCHKKIEDKVLLRDSRGGYPECIRCFQLVRRSRNIIEVFSKDLSGCYTDENIAIQSCSQLNNTAILYRTSKVGGEKIRNEYCPIAGKYRYKYSVNNDYAIMENNNAESKDECTAFSSEVDNCPNGSLLQLHFKRCSFEDHDISLECLGSWSASNTKTGSDAQRYVAFLDSRGASDFSGPHNRRRPRYRCGLYRVDSRTSKTYLSLSSDSSCTQNLYNSTSGYETFVLSKSTSQKQMPSYVREHYATFPQWAQGEWEETLIINGTMTFNDLNGYKSFTFVTVDSDEENGRYIVYSRDQCDNDGYICLTLKQRSENVLEFITGTTSSPIYQPLLCNDTSMLQSQSSSVWWTLARLERSVESPCPITGQYVGRITDLPGMCAELSSNCNTRQIMYYKAYDCETAELYEERTYLCLGQWDEQGVTYTYTRRNDTGTNECFVGAIVNDEEIYIKEAGDYCIRNIDPKTEGMRLYKKGQCFANSSSPAPTIPTTTSNPRVPSVRVVTPLTPTINTRLPKYTTRPRIPPTRVAISNNNQSKKSSVSPPPPSSSALSFLLTDCKFNRLNLILALVIIYTFNCLTKKV